MDGCSGEKEEECFQGVDVRSARKRWKKLIIKLQILKINENWHYLKWWGGRGVLSVDEVKIRRVSKKINCFRREQAKWWASAVSQFSLKAQKSQLSISKFYFLYVSLTKRKTTFKLNLIWSRIYKWASGPLSAGREFRLLFVTII